MFLLFGHRATKIAEVTKQINDGGYPRLALIQIYQRYAHLFWIPLFPLYRNYLIHFPDNDSTYVKSMFKKMPEEYKIACKEVSREARTPWWTFIGIAVFGLLIFWLESST